MLRNLWLGPKLARKILEEFFKIYLSSSQMILLQKISQVFSVNLNIISMDIQREQELGILFISNNLSNYINFTSEE